MPVSPCDLVSSVFQQVQKYGYAFVPKWLEEQTTQEVADILGTAVDFASLLSSSGVPNIQTIRPRSEEDASKHIYSGLFGFGDFPLHTDLAHWAMPPRFFILRCVRGDKQVSTRLLPSSTVIEKFGETRLRRTLFKPRRRVRNRSASLLPLVFSYGDIIVFRWDEVFLSPVSNEASEILDAIRSSSTTWSEQSEVVLENPGDTLIIDNWRMLHGRSEAKPGSSRIIERIYLSEVWF